MSLYYIAIAAFIVLVGLCLLIIQKRWLHALATIGLYAGLVMALTFGMGGLRPHIEEARSQGYSEDYIQGLAARNKRLAPVRIEALIYGSGLVLVGLAGWLRRPKAKDYR